MGKSFKRFDKDGEYHDVRWDRQKSSDTRERRHTARDITEEEVEEPVQKTKFKRY